MRKIGSRVESQVRARLRRVLLSASLLLLVTHCGVEQPAANGNERVAQTSSALLSPAWTATVSMKWPGRTTSPRCSRAARCSSPAAIRATTFDGNRGGLQPATSTWTTVGSMGTARRLFGACTLASGKVLVAGGNAGVAT